MTNWFVYLIVYVLKHSTELATNAGLNPFHANCMVVLTLSPLTNDLFLSHTIVMCYELYTIHGCNTVCHVQPKQVQIGDFKLSLLLYTYSMVF